MVRGPKWEYSHVNKADPNSGQNAYTAAQFVKGLNLVLNGGTTTINSLTVDATQFVGTLLVYAGTQATGVPMFQVSSGQIKTMPIGVKSLWIVSPTLGVGTAYLQWTDQFLSSTTNLNTVQPIASKPWYALTEGQVLASLPHGTISDPVWGTLAYIILNNTSFAVDFTNGKGTAPTIWLQSLEVTGLPPYVSIGVDFISSGSPNGLAPLLTGSGRWAPAQAVKFGTLAVPSPLGFAMFGNYDDVSQLFGSSMNFTLTGYSV